MVENQNVNINLIYNFVIPGFSRGQGVPLHRGIHQRGVYTSPNKCIAYPRTLYPTEYILARTKLYPDLTEAGYSLQRLYLGLKRSRPYYTRVYYGLGQFIPRGILWPEGV